MNSGAFKSSVGCCAVINRFSVSVLASFFMLSPQCALAAAADAQFKQFLNNLCVLGTVTPPPGVNWNNVALNQMCLTSQTGYVTGGGGPASANLGTVNADSAAALRKKKRSHELQDEQKEKTEKGASADSSRWGFLLTPQYGNSNRIETDLENGYKSKLNGLVAGLDYRFSDSFVLGATIGQTKDTATFFNSAGSLKTSNNTFDLYGTWILSENTSVDGYLGYGKLNFDSNRHVEFGAISGTTNGSTNGQQVMAGVSASYQKDIGRLNLSPFINFDYIKTSINSYNESGTTGLEMHYFDRSTISFTSSLGARASTSYSYDWGTLQPSARLATVHEFQNKARQINNELVLTPGAGFSVSTDAPDRNYLNIGLGLSAALNGGAQLFLDYDKRAQDKLLSSWAVSAGVLVGY